MSTSILYDPTCVRTSYQLLVDASIDEYSLLAHVCSFNVTTHWRLVIREETLKVIDYPQPRFTWDCVSDILSGREPSCEVINWEHIQPVP